MVILSATETESEVLGTQYAGQYQLVCLVYGSSPVMLEVRDPDHSDTWVTARYNSTDISFNAAGDSLDVVLTKGFDYRLKTTTAGAVISIDRHLGL